MKFWKRLKIVPKMNLIVIIILKMLLKKRLPLILTEKILIKKIPVKKTMIKYILMKKFKSTKNSCRRKKNKKVWDRYKNIAEGKWQKLNEYMRNIVHFKNIKAIRFVFLDESLRCLGTFLDILLDLSQVHEFFTTKEMLPTTTALSNAYHLCGSC